MANLTQSDVSGWGTDSSPSFGGSDSWDATGGNSITQNQLQNWGATSEGPFAGSDDFGGSGDPYGGYTTGQWSDPGSPAYSPQSQGGGNFLDSFWESIKRYGKGRAMGAVTQRAGAAAPLVGPLIAGMNAPEGKRTEAAGNSFGANTLNTMLYGVNPILGAANSLYGMFTGKTLGGTAWDSMNRGGDNSKFDQNTGASRGNYGNMDNLITGLAGMYGANKANSALKDQMNSLTGMYGQDSPYAQTLRQTLARKDAKAGRRSSAGPREVELQARLAQLASQNSGAVANLQGQRNQNNMQKLNSLMYLGRQSGLFGGIGSMFQQQPMTQNDISNWGTGPQVPFEE